MNKRELLLLVGLTLGVLMMANAFALVPTGPTIVYKGNSTSQRTSPTVEDNASLKGGTITTILLTGRQQTTPSRETLKSIFPVLVERFMQPGQRAL